MKILIGNSIIDSDNIVEIEEKDIKFNITKTKPNPEKKPTKGFLKKMMYSDTIEYTENETYRILILKVKGGVQVTVSNRKHDDDTIYLSEPTNTVNTHQLYDFYTIYNDKNFLKRATERKSDSDLMCEIGNYRTLGGLFYANYLSTNMLLMEDIKTKEDFVKKYI